MKRVSSLPAKILFGSSKKLSSPPAPAPAAANSVHEEVKKKKKKVMKSHPLFSLFDARPRKTTAKPEFARYLEFIKERGVWDMNSNKPVIYFN